MISATLCDAALATARSAPVDPLNPNLFRIENFGPLYMRIAEYIELNTSTPTRWDYQRQFPAILPTAMPLSAPTPHLVVNLNTGRIHLGAADGHLLVHIDQRPDHIRLHGG